jgi:hypothetical protein
MSAPHNTLNDLLNSNGSKELRRDGSWHRLHSKHVTHMGVDMEVEYSVDGAYLPSTDIDDECQPVCIPKHILVGGVDIMNLLDENVVSEIAQKVETQCLR